jgi:hypothetical protein
MEKYRFNRKLQEAVWRRKEGQQPAIIIDGKEMKVRNPVFVGNRAKDITCLVEEDNKAGNTGYTVVAISFSNVDKKDKEWICTSPELLEQAVGFFIENHQMESMSGTCRCASRLADARDSGFGLETENFMKWQQTILEMGNIFRKVEKTMSKETMEQVWTSAFFGIYLHYETKKDFMPQFDANTQRFFGVMNLAFGERGYKPVI